MTSLFSNRQKPTIKYLDWSKNDIKHISRFIIYLFPNLKAFDLSENLLFGRYSEISYVTHLCPGLIELFCFHPSLEFINIGKQEIRSCNTNVKKTVTLPSNRVAQGAPKRIVPITSISNPLLSQCFETKINTIP